MGGKISTFSFASLAWDNAFYNIFVKYFNCIPKFKTH